MDTLNLENRKQLRKAAALRLNSAELGGKIALVYAAITVGAGLIANCLQYLFSYQMAQSGGLENIGIRSVLSTLQSMLPIVMNFLLMALGLGFIGAMLRISRGQYTSPMYMKVGFERFWVLLRATLLKIGLYCLATIAAYIIAAQIFLLFPMPKELATAIAPALTGQTADVMALLENPYVQDQIIRYALPRYLLMGVLFLAIAIPIHYRYVLVNFILIDHPGIGALMAMQMSKTIMRKKVMQFLKLDLSLWPYYVSSVISLIVCYGAVLVSLTGVTLQISFTALSLICLGLYLVMSFCIILFLQPHVVVTHALAYESLRPKEPTGGVVLGNIFDLAREQQNEQL